MNEFNPYTADPFAADSTENGSNPYQQEEDISQSSVPDDKSTNTYESASGSHSHVNKEHYFDSNASFDSAAENNFNNVIPTNVYSGDTTSSINKTSNDKNLATVSLVFGLISMVTGCFCFGEIFAILAIILGSVYISRNKDGDHRGKAITGIITGVLSIVLVIVLVIFVAVFAEDDIMSDIGSSISYDIDEIIDDFSRDDEAVEYQDYLDNLGVEESFTDETNTDELPNGNLKSLIIKASDILSLEDDDIDAYVGGFYNNAWVTDYASMQGWLTVEGYEYHDVASYEYYRDSFDADAEMDNIKQYYDVKNPKYASHKEGTVIYGIDKDDETLIFLTCFLDDSDIQLNVTIFAYDDNDLNFAKMYLKHLHDIIGISDFSKDINL